MPPKVDLARLGFGGNLNQAFGVVMARDIREPSICTLVVRRTASPSQAH